MSGRHFAPKGVHREHCFSEADIVCCAVPARGNSSAAGEHSAVLTIHANVLCAARCCAGGGIVARCPYRAVEIHRKERWLDVFYPPLSPALSPLVPHGEKEKAKTQLSLKRCTESLLPQFRMH